MRILPARSRVATATIGVVLAVALRGVARVRRRVIAAARAVMIAMIAGGAAAPAAVLRVRETAPESREASEVRAASGMTADIVTSAISVRPSRRRRAFPW